MGTKINSPTLPSRAEGELIYMEYCIVFNKKTQQEEKIRFNPKYFKGAKFGRLTLDSYSHKKGGHYYWDAVCDCGGTKTATINDIARGNTNSCGCLHSESIRKHNLSGTNIYNTWNFMRQRCFNPKATGYELYGSRGITVCEKWLKFEGFYEDMGDRPLNMSLDRIDRNGNYCKENCKWSTQMEQTNHTSRNVYITFDGKTQTIAQWAREVNIEYATLNTRITKLKWTIERSLTEKMNEKFSYRRSNCV